MSAPADEKGGDEAVREQDKFLPIANISRIMKNALPSNAKISKEAKESVQECVSEFICFITSEASDKCQREKRKTINGDDLLWAMQTLGFEDTIDVLKRYLTKIREAEGDKNAKGPSDTGDAAAPSGQATGMMPVQTDGMMASLPPGYAYYAPMAGMHMGSMPGQPNMTMGMRPQMVMMMPQQQGGTSSGMQYRLVPQAQMMQQHSGSLPPHVPSQQPPSSG